MAKGLLIALYLLCAVPAFSSDQQSAVRCVYMSQVGVREATGQNDGTQVEAYLRYVGLGKGYAWCAAFVCWVFGQAEVPNPKSAWSPSMFPAKNVIYKRGAIDKATPAAGDVFGIYYGNIKRVGHVGFVDEWGDKYAITVEGNTNDAGSREGDGVYRKRRLRSQIYIVSRFISQS